MTTEQKKKTQLAREILPLLRKAVRSNVQSWDFRRQIECVVEAELDGIDDFILDGIDDFISELSFNIDKPTIANVSKLVTLKDAIDLFHSVTAYRVVQDD
jgi:hypothetical protein